MREQTKACRDQTKNPQRESAEQRAWQSVNEVTCSKLEIGVGSEHLAKLKLDNSPPVVVIVVAASARWQKTASRKNLIKTLIVNNFFQQPLYNLASGEDFLCFGLSSYLLVRSAYLD